MNSDSVLLCDTVAPDSRNTFFLSTYYTNNEACFRHLIGKGLKKNSENVIIIPFLVSRKK